jgi:hypothetical protein
VLEHRSLLSKTWALEVSCYVLEHFVIKCNYSELTWKYKGTELLSVVRGISIKFFVCLSSLFLLCLFSTRCKLLISTHLNTWVLKKKKPTQFTSLLVFFSPSQICNPRHMYSLLNYLISQSRHCYRQPPCHKSSPPGRLLWRHFVILFWIHLDLPFPPI